MVTGRGRDRVPAKRRRGRRGVGHLRHGQGRRSYGEAYAHGAAETGKSGHSSINSESRTSGSVHAQRPWAGCAVEKYWVVGCPHVRQLRSMGRFAR